MFLGNTLGVVLMLGSMLPSISAKDTTLNVSYNIYAMSVDVINEKIYYWYDVDKTSRKTAFPSPIEYDLVEDVVLPYDELFEMLGTTYPNETHNVYIDYDVDFKTTNRRINFGYVALPSNYEMGDSDTYWQGTSFVNANNVVSNRGYESSIYLGDWDMGTINYAFTSYCLGWYCENLLTTTNYADVRLNLPYLLRVEENMTLDKVNAFIYLQNSFYTKTYNDYFINQTTYLSNEARYYKEQYEIALDVIENLQWELDNNVENVFDWFKNVFTAFAGFLNMEIAPNVTIGMLLGIPLIGFALFFILKLTLS